MTVASVQLFSIPAADQDRARDFYAGVLGFTVVADSEMGPGRRWVQLSLPGAQTSITLVTWFETMPAGSRKGVVLASDELDADVARLRARGVAVEGEIQQAPWGRDVTFDDPDGNGLGLQAPPPGA